MIAAVDDQGLIATRCAACGDLRFPPRLRCPSCGAAELQCVAVRCGTVRNVTRGVSGTIAEIDTGEGLLVLGPLSYDGAPGQAVRTMVEDGRVLWSADIGGS